MHTVCMIIAGFVKCNLLRKTGRKCNCKNIIALNMYVTLYKQTTLKDNLKIYLKDETCGVIYACTATAFSLINSGYSKSY